MSYEMIRSSEVQRTEEQTVLFSHSLGGTEQNDRTSGHVLQPRFEWAVYRKVNIAELSILCAKNAMNL
jgi:hypothetical protein